MEIYENLAQATVNAALPNNYNGWSFFNPGNLGVILDGSDRVLTGKGSDGTGTGKGAIHRAIIGAGEIGRIEAKVKFNTKTFAETYDYFRIGFRTDNAANDNALNLRMLWFNWTGDLALWNGDMDIAVVTNANIPIGEWITLSFAFDGTGRYTAVVTNAAGSVLGSMASNVPGDAGMPLYAYIMFGGDQATVDGNGWGTAYYMKDIISRNDFKAYDTVSQRRPLRFRALVNGESAYVTIPANWGTPNAQTKGIIAGHGFTATANFYSSSDTYADAGFAHANSNTHGDSWGNAQSQSDVEVLRKWMVSKLGIEEKIIQVGYSMGGLNAFNYATHYPDKVDRIVTEAGVANLKFTYGDAAYTASMNTAYGVTKFEDIPREFDPMRNLEKLVNIPIVCWAGNQDVSIPYDVNTRLLVERLARLGGKVAYFEEDGETHSNDWDYARNLDLIRAHISSQNPYLSNNLVESIDSKTQLIKLAENTVYRITTNNTGIVSYALDSEDGTLTTVVNSETYILTKHRPMMILLVVSSGHTFNDVTMVKTS